MKLKRLLVTLWLLTTTINVWSAKKPRIIAHRGYWRVEGSARNSVSSWRNAIREGFYGSEFDVSITKDGVPLVYHDPKTVNGLVIVETDFSELRKNAPRLANDELIPTVEDYFKAWNRAKTKLILEIKEHPTPEMETRAVEAVLELVKKYNIKDKEIEFISFSYHIFTEILRLRPTAVVMPLQIEPSVEQMAQDKMKGIDFHYSAYDENPEYLEQARRLKMQVNVWTVNSDEQMLKAISNEVDFITTDEPIRLRELLKGK